MDGLKAKEDQIKDVTTYLLCPIRQLLQVPDGDSVEGGEIDHRLRSEEAVNLPLRGVLGGEDLLVDLDELETLVVLTVHSRFN